MNNLPENLIDKTIISTPKPCASSTIERKEILRKIDKKYGVGNTLYNTFEETDSSLGIISNIDEKDDLEPAHTNEESIYLRLQKQRELAQSTLEKPKIYGLSSRFLVPSETSYSIIKKNSKSTINESDILAACDRIESSIISASFLPDNISTPRNSSVNPRPIHQSSKLTFDNISDISKKIRNSDVSLTDLCSELNGFSVGNSRPQSNVPDIDSGIFTPAELMEDKLLKDELSWRRERGIPTKSESISSVSNFNQYDGKYSVGDFFTGRCDNISNDFFKRSPSKKDPTPLVDLTNTVPEIDVSRMSVVTNLENTRDDSILSITQIAKIVSEYGSQDTPRILNCLLNKNGLEQTTQLNNTVTSERDVDEFILASKEIDSNKIPPPTRRSVSPNFKRGSLYQPCECSSNYPVITTTSPSLCENQDTRYSRTPINIKELHCNIDRPLHSGNSTSLSISPRNTISNSPSEDKENNRSLTSIRSGSSLDSIPEGKFPIKSNRVELVWGCLKVGRTGTQEFQIRNQLNQRIRMQATITGSAFRIVKDYYGSEPLTTTSFILRPLETKSLNIMFHPTKLGAAAEKINFHPVLAGEIQHSKRQVLTLYGYGGHISCDVAVVAKDSSGKQWLSLGKIEHQTYIEKKFVIRNNGNLMAFALVDIYSKGPFSFSDLKINPRECVIKPQGEVSVIVRYSPSKADLQYFKKMDIVEVGHVKIVTGAEAIRGRIRRLHTKLKQQNVPVDPLVDRLSKEMPGEKMPTDLRFLKESVSAMKDLLQQLLFREITITVEQDLESTLVNQIDMEDNSVYYTLYQDDADLSTLDNSVIPRKHNPRKFKVEPTNIVLTLPVKKEDTILLHSDCSHEMPFEIKTEPNSVLRTYPTQGLIAPYDTVLIKVFYEKFSSTRSDIERILVCVENEVTEIVVKSVFIKSK